MTAGSSFTSIFGGNAIRPAQPSFQALSIAVTTALQWPIESTEGALSVSAQMNVTATATGLQLQMPPGNTGSCGVVSLVSNVGANSFTLTDTAGNQICVIAASQSYVISLVDNSTTNGTWTSLQLGATTSNASAGSLAGLGLQANGALLQVDWPTVYLTTTTLITAPYRSQAIVWQGGTSTLQLDYIANLGSGWICAFSNEGTGTLTIDCSGGQTINGAAALVVAPGNSGFIIATTSGSSPGFNSIGFLPGSLSIANGGTGASTANAALTNFGGTAIGVSIFTAPSAASVISLLGLSLSIFTEQTVSANQTLASNSTGTLFVSTAAISFTLPLTTTIPKTFVVGIAAASGAVTITPQSTDNFPGLATGASFTLAQGMSCLLCTDAAGHWYPFWTSPPMTSGGNMSVPGTLAVSGTSTLTGNVTMGGTLGVTGNVTMSGTLGCGPLTVTGNVTTSGNISSNGSISTPNNLHGGVSMIPVAGSPAVGYVNFYDQTGASAGSIGQSDMGTNLQLQLAGGTYTGWKVLGQFSVAIQASGTCVTAIIPNSGYSGTCFNGTVNNTSQALALWYDGVTAVGSITTNGTTTAYNTTSDQRIKIDKGNPDEADDVIAALTVRKFVYAKKPDAAPTIGFYAQEAVKVLPDAVREGIGEPGDEDFHPMMIDHTKMVPHLVLAMQRQAARMVVLEARLAKLGG